MHALLDTLQQQGWTIDKPSRPWTIPVPIRTRYDWVPSQVISLLCSISRASAPDERAWLVTGADFNGQSIAAFRWNEWEHLSLGAAKADGDRAWMLEIEAFWDDHFPISTSVRGGYAFLAIERDSLNVVMGREPEFEETELVAESFIETLRMMSIRASEVSLFA